MHEWNNMQYAASAAFLLAVYSDYLSASNSVLKCSDAQIQPQELLNFAKSQACPDLLFILHTFFPGKQTLCSFLLKKKKTTMFAFSIMHKH